MRQHFEDKFVLKILHKVLQKVKISHILEIVRFKKFEVQLKFKAAAERINLNKRSIKFGEMEHKIKFEKLCCFRYEFIKRQLAYRSDRAINLILFLLVIILIKTSYVKF
jgi:hypothetical protein